MGWFLIKKKKLRGPVQPADSQGQSNSWAGRGGKYLLMALPFLALVLLTCVAWRSGERLLSRYVASEPIRAVTIRHVRLADAPTWMEPAARQKLQIQALTQLKGPRLAHEPLKAVADSLNSDPWVQRVRRIQRTRDGGIIIHADYRRPAAAIETAEGYVRIDAQAVRLPGNFVRNQVASLRLPVIVGVSSPAPANGQLWQGEDVASGLKLIQTLIRQPYRHRIAVIDVKGRDRRGELQIALVTPDRSIIWGLPPDQGVPIEADTATKLQRLKEVMNESPERDRYPTYDIHGADIFELRSLDAQASLSAFPGIARSR